MSQELMILTISLTVISGVLSLVALILGALALTKTIGLEKSTHTVQMMPIDPEIDKINNKYVEEWATKEESISEQEKLFREDLEEKMPEFLEEDKEIISW